MAKLAFTALLVLLANAEGATREASTPAIPYSTVVPDARAGSVGTNYRGLDPVAVYIVPSKTMP